MKRLLTLLVFLFLGSTIAFAGNGFDVNFEANQGNIQELSFELDEYSFENIAKNGMEYSEINFANGVFTKEKGFAKLPIIHASIQLMNNRNVSFEVIDADYMEYRLENPLLPSRGTIYRNQDPSTIPYNIAPESVVNEFYPNETLDSSEPFIIRDVRGINLYAYPFRYNAAEQIVRVYTSITVKVIENSSNPINPLSPRTSKITREMNSLYQSAFINYDLTRFENELGQFGSILYLYTARDANAVAPLRQWKLEKGFTVYSEEVATGTNVTSLVQDQYDAHNDILYVQLVGDWADIQGPSSGGDPNDPMLGCVVGGDNYPDLITGRISANNSSQVTTQVEKVFHYEKTPDMSLDWFSAATGVASNQGPGDDGELDNQHIDVIWNDKLDPFTYDTFSPIYDPAANVTMVADAVNTGTSIINYCGHGSTTSWSSSGFSNSDVNNLTNGDKLPLIISVACVNGNFDGEECFAEAWLKKENGGAIGMLASTINQSWNPPMMGQDYMNDMLIGGYNYDDHPGQSGINTDTQKTTMGAICLNGTILMTMEDFGGGLSEMKCWTYFGDPTAQIRTAFPEDLLLSNETVLMGVDFSTTVTANGNPVEGALVSLYQDGEIYTAITDVSGNVTIPQSCIAGTATLTVTALNTETINDEVTVVPPGGPYILLGDYEIDDSAGNNNGQVDFGETILLNVNYENVGSDPANSVDVSITSADEYITITDDSENYGDIPAEESVTIDGAFAFDVHNDIPNEHSILFEYEAIDENDSTWTGTFMINGFAPVISLSSVIVDDENGQLDPGDVTDIIVSLDNTGGADAVNVENILSYISGDDLVTINENTDEIDLFASGTQETAIFNISVSDDASIGDVADFQIDISADNEFATSVEFSKTIGIIIADFETGDFSDFPWEFGGSANWTISSDAYEGEYSAQSGTITDNQVTSLSIALDVLVEGEISFWKKVSSEDNYDYLRFYIDDEQMGEWCGDVSWSEEIFEVSPGNHTFIWSYEKDGSVSSGSDCGWIDYIIFPTVTLPVPPEIEINPAEFDITLDVNSTTTEILSLSNVGGGSVDYSINLEETTGRALQTSEYKTNVARDIAKKERIANGFVIEPAAVTSFVNPDYAPNSRSTDVTISCDGGSWQSEVGWEIENSSGTVVASGGAPFNGNASLDNDVYTVLATDSYGDGWNGNYLIITSLDGTQYLNYTLEGGSSGTTTFEIDEAPPVSWIELSETSGSILGGETDEIEVNFDTDSLTYGETYTADMTINSNVGSIVVPITLTVLENSTGSTEPAVTSLLDNFPNPFTNSTKISFSLSQDALHSELNIYNILGQLVKTYRPETSRTGENEFIWNGTDELGQPVSSGIYFYRLTTEKQSVTKKMIMIK